MRGGKRHLTIDRQPKREKGLCIAKPVGIVAAGLTPFNRGSEIDDHDKHISANILDAVFKISLIIL